MSVPVHSALTPLPYPHPGGKPCMVYSCSKIAPIQLLSAVSCGAGKPSNSRQKPQGSSSNTHPCTKRPPPTHPPNHQTTQPPDHPTTQPPTNPSTDQTPQPPCATTVQQCVVFTLNRSFDPTTSSVHPVSVLILHPRDTNYVVADCETEQTKQS